MKEEFKTPEDNKLMTEKYKIEKGGICGQSCLAVIEKSSIQEVMNNWSKLDMEFKGWSSWRQLSSYLKNRGFSVKQKNKLDFFSPDCFYIARVQWKGEGEKKEKPFYGWDHWFQASAYTHFIVIVKNQQFFCNETDWDSISNLQSYLLENNGLITSFLEIIAPNSNSKGSPSENSFNKDLTATQQVASPKCHSDTSLNPDIMFNKLKMLQSDSKWKNI